MNRTPTLEELSQYLSAVGIQLHLRKSNVKHINFRLSAYKLSISAPKQLSNKLIAHALHQRLPWALNHHQTLITKTHQTQRLWGEPTHFDDERSQLQCYRQELQTLIPTLQATWQPIVGQVAKEVRLKKMHTRWGTCNTKEKRIWLSLYLAAYPPRCTHYVFVHELCHLYHPNHSAAFWQQVAKAMPDYQRWHALLRHT